MVTDDALDAAIRPAMDRHAFDDPARLRELDAAGRGITRLDGIEQFRGLRRLRLDDNAISDLAPLAALTAVTGPVLGQ